jgi:asparagine synthetase B (glutamine-hydrolysing)
MLVGRNGLLDLNLPERTFSHGKASTPTSTPPEGHAHGLEDSQREQRALDLLARHSPEQWPRRDTTIRLEDPARGESIHRGPSLSVRKGDSPFEGGVYESPDLVLAYCGRLRNLDAAQGPLSGQSVDHVVGRMFERYGHEAMDRLDGLIAVVLWDRREGVFRVYRDALGLIPLYWSRRGGEIYVSTDPQWLLSRLDQKPAVNDRRLLRFMYGSMDCERDDFASGLFRIRPGERACWAEQRCVSFSPWWSPRFEPWCPDKGPARLLDVLAALSGCDAGPTPVVSLSGGLDSAVLAAALTTRAGSEAVPVRVASMIWPRLARGDERGAIDELVRHLPLDLHTFEADRHWPLRRLETYGQFLATGPQFHPEEIWTEAFLGSVGETLHPTALIFGNGADDVLWCPASVYRRRLIELGRWPEARRLGGSAMALRSAVGLCWERTGWNHPWIDRLRQRPASTRDTWIWRDPSRWVRSDPQEAPSSGWVEPGSDWRTQRLRRLQTWKWELICRTLNRHARRARFPLLFPMLDREFWALCLSIETTQLVENGRQKAPLRQAAASVLPRSVGSRHKHGGFDALVEEGLAHREVRCIRGLFERSRLAARGLIDASRFFEAYEAYCAADSTLLGAPYLGSLGIWQTIAAELWMSRFVQEA